MIQASEYRDAGFHVFGLHGTTRGVCGCGNEDCTAFYKHPMISNWQITPLWDAGQFSVMQDMGSFSTGFGVLCDGYLVIDIDPRNGGNEGYEQLVKDTGINFKESCGFLVATGGGGWHIYYKYDGAEKLSSNIKAYSGIDFKSSGFVVGAGSLHASGNRYEVEDGFPDELTVLPEALHTLLAKPVFTGGNFTVQAGNEVSAGEVEELLKNIKNNDLDYEEWIQTGMAIHDSLGPEGFSVWDSWSQKSDKYCSSQMEYKYHSFGKNPNKITIATLIQKAREGGYIQPVTFESTIAEVPMPITEDIDLNKAPGLVGECVKYINSCSRFPREQLAISAALGVIASIGGMRFKDEEYGVTANLFLFNVAGSSTGKEAIQQAYNDLLIEVGVNNANYSQFKSEQEIYRNVLEHQLVSYSTDELGIVLNKIEQASKGGGAAYLGGILGALMSIYSKANGKLLLVGDFKRDLIKENSKEMAAIQKLVDAHEAKSFHLDRLESLKKMAKQLEQGFIDNPFLMLTGYTTPSTFHNVVNYQQASSGFIGRSLIFEEKDNNPRAKKRFQKGALSDELKFKLMKLKGGGHHTVNPKARIEHNGPMASIHTESAATELLDTLEDEFHNMAEEAMESNGLEAVIRRGFELLLKVSMVLAMGDGEVRTVEHVKWAAALVKRDLQTKVNLTLSSMAKEEKDLSVEVMSKVKHKLDVVNGLTVGAIKNKLRTLEVEHIQEALDHLVKSGQAKCVSNEVKNRSGFTIKKYHSLQ